LRGLVGVGWSEQCCRRWGSAQRRGRSTGVVFWRRIDGMEGPASFVGPRRSYQGVQGGRGIAVAADRRRQKLAGVGKRGAVVCAGEEGSARLFIGRNWKGMSTRRVWGSSWTGEEDELTMLLVFPWAPVRCREQGARGGVVWGEQASKKAVWGTAARVLDTWCRWGCRVGARAASCGGALAGGEKQGRQLGGAAWQGEDAPAEEGSGARGSKEGRMAGQRWRRRPVGGEFRRRRCCAVSGHAGG